MTRTVYVMPAPDIAGGEVKLEPRQIKVGVSDGATTEVLEGLNEGDVIVTAAITADGLSGARPASNPFGGGFPRRF